MHTISLTSTNQEATVEAAVNTLAAGGLVVAPSDTVYGLLVDVTNEEAVRKLITFKNRPIGKAISVFVSDFSMMKQIVEVGKHEQLLSELLPGPFTVVLPSNHKVSLLLESERGSLGVRIPDYPFITELIKQYGKPITATSANLSGRSPHYSIHSLLSQLPESKKKLVDLVADAGELPRNKPSTVIDLSKSDIKILRHGDIPFSDTHIYISKSPSQTKKIAKHIAYKLVHRSPLSTSPRLRGAGTVHRPLVFILQGELGSGKTVFAKGIGEYFGIHDIVSPTYTIYDEYPISKIEDRSSIIDYRYLYHFDLYQVEEEEEFKHLGIEKMLAGKNILCIEWGEKAESLRTLLKEKSDIVYIHIRYEGEKKRVIDVRK